MPDKFKNLFNPNLLASRSAGLELCLDSREQAIVERWSRISADPLFRQETERSTQAQFFVEIFGYLLGFTLPAGHLDAHNIKMETASREVKGGRTPDARLGFYGPDYDFTRVVVELKAPGADLDAKQSGYGNITPVDQAFGYLGMFDDCRWVIVSNFIVVRLYSKKRGQGYAHEFYLSDLTDEDALRQFLFLLQCDNLLAEPPDNSVVDQLLAQMTNEEQAITRRFYTFYSDLRLRLFQHLVKANPPPSNADQTTHEVWLLAAAQKVLDRVLFICFCEDTGLLPHGIVYKAFEATSAGFIDTDRWQQLCGLFRAVDQGLPRMGIPSYNGGLFRHDPQLEALAVPDEALIECLQLSDYDFQTDVDVNILGHIFEQSISDLEAIRARIRGEAEDKRQSKRKREGVFYTPEYITRFIVAHTVGSWLEERFAALVTKHMPDAIPDTYHVKKLAARLALWEEYQQILATIKILDPACGSGAFLVAAFNFLHAEYTRVTRQLTELRGGQPELFDLDKLILQQNLYGVDINPESVEITKLSLWLKTARTDRPLNDLDANIKCGNSLATPHPDLSSDLAIRAFDWQTEFPEVIAAGGFHCVIGNPPYIRQEWLAPYKSGFKREFDCYSGTADAYLYFFERGMQVLTPGGQLGFITSGSFNNANFAVPFRQWLPRVGRFTHVVNFGENQPFEDAEMVYPTISIIRKDLTARSFRFYFMHGKIPDSIPDAIAKDGIDCDDTVFGQKEWRFQPTAVTTLFKRLISVGRPLGEVVQGRIYRGVMTGLNDAFIIDQVTRDRLVAQDPGCDLILKKLLRGQDLRPWYYKDEGRWLIAMPCGLTRQQTSADSEVAAWSWFANAYPSVASHLEPFAERGRKRCDKGEFWWELRSCDYYSAFDEPKILWPDISKLPRFSWDDAGYYLNTSGYIIPCDPWLLAVLQSRVVWFCLSQIATPLRLRGGLWQYRCINQFIRRLPIPNAHESDRQALVDMVARATATARERYVLHEKFRHRILTDLDDGTHKLNQKLMAWWDLDFRAFRTELGKAFKSDITLRERSEWEDALTDWQSEHRSLTTRLVDLESSINDCVYHFFALTPAERKILDDHMHDTMIDYPLGEV